MKANAYSEDLLEMPWLTVEQYRTATEEDLEENWETWLEIFEHRINSKLPEDVYIDMRRCEQAGDGEYLDEDEFEGLINEVERSVDDDIANYITYLEGRIIQHNRETAGHRLFVIYKEKNTWQIQ